MALLTRPYFDKMIKMWEERHVCIVFAVLKIEG